MLGIGDDVGRGGAGDDYLDAGPGDDQVTGDEGDDEIHPGDGADYVYGDEGANHIIATNDGVRDHVYCSSIDDPSQPNGTLTYLDEVDPLDVVADCDVEVVPAVAYRASRGNPSTR
jgi:Ca2+-binding RTX toxin-like protein